MKNRLVSALVKKLGEYKKVSTYLTEELCFKCIYCKDWNNRLYVNIQRKLFYCHNCKKSGRVGDILGKGYLNKPISCNRCFDEFIEKPINMPVDFIEIKKYNSIYDLPIKIIEFLKKRGGFNLFYDKRIKEWGVFGTDVENSRLIIPIKQDGMIYTWVERAVDDSEPKELTAPSAVTGNKRSNFLYGYDWVGQEESIILVEGIFDCIYISSLGFKCMALMGSAISDIQIGKLLSKKPKSIWIMMDGDDAGQKASKQIKLKIAKRFDITKIRELKLELNKDPDELSESEVNIMVNSNAF